MKLEFIIGSDSSRFETVARIQVDLTPKVRFVDSQGTEHEVYASEWKKVLMIDADVTWYEPPCSCCKNLFQFVVEHCPNCGSTLRLVTGHSPEWTAVCTDCDHRYHIGQEAKKYLAPGL